MKILAQHGFGPKDKLDRAISEKLVDGVILSPKYLTQEKMKEQVESLSHSGCRIFMDPEYYAIVYARTLNSNLGALEEWDHFQVPRRSELISGKAIPGIIQQSLLIQKRIGFKEWIAPNIYIREADSIDTAIALNFISNAKEQSAKIGGCPIYATLAVDRDAIVSNNEFRDILDALTALDSPPDGYYVLVGSGAGRGNDSQTRSDLYQSQVIAGWMYLNFVLSINGARVMNGCCHLLSPLLGICGAESTASGWFSNLRRFYIRKYVKEGGGGRYPLVRYVSMPLLAHIKQTDYLDFKAVVPEIANKGSFDAIYDKCEPSRTDEALQSWEALSGLAEKFPSDDIEGGIDLLSEHIDHAVELWTELQEAGFAQDIESNLERLTAMQDGIGLFQEWAELV